jgi:CheY-like chemotaxis protein
MMILARASVLVVEDDEVDVMAMRRAFVRKGLAEALQFSRDGQAALDLLRGPGLGALPGLVLLDQNMPRMTGLEFLRELRAEPRLSGIPVIMLTTSRNAAEKKEAEALGVLAYLVKEDLLSDYQGLFDLLATF